MKNKQQASIIMLPTNKSTLFILSHQDSGDALCYHETETEKFVSGDLSYNDELPQHLYLLFGEDIKKGDWFYNKGVGVIMKDAGGYNDNVGHEHVDKILFKIIASTDVSLGLPLIPQLFVQYYAKKQGRIDKVNIEMEEWTEHQGTMGEKYHYIPKIKDNYVIVSPLKENWNRAEVETLLKMC